MCLAGGEGSELPPHAVRSFGAAFEEKLAESSSQLDDLKGSHRNVDDELGRILEGVNGQLNSAAETLSLKTDLLQRNAARLTQLEEQVGSCRIPYTLNPTCYTRHYTRRSPIVHE